MDDNRNRERGIHVRHSREKLIKMYDKEGEYRLYIVKWNDHEDRDERDRYHLIPVRHI